MQIRLWEMRTAKGLTLMELAKKSGIGKSTLNNIENGKVSPTLFQLETIAIALEVRITDLFESEYRIAHFSMIVEKSDIISIIVEISPRTDDHSSHHAIIILFVLGFKQVCDSDLQCNRFRFKLKQCR